MFYCDLENLRSWTDLMITNTFNNVGNTETYRVKLLDQISELAQGQEIGTRNMSYSYLSNSILKYSVLLLCSL